MNNLISRKEVFFLAFIPVAGFFTCNSIALLVAPWILIAAATIYANFYRGVGAAIKILIAFLILAIGRAIVPNPWLDFMNEDQKLFFIIKTSLPYVIWGIPYMIEALVGNKIKSKALHLFFLPALAELIEFLFILKGSSLSSLSATQYDNIMLAQIASLTGITGVIFMMQLFASFIADFAMSNFDFAREKKTIALVVMIFLLVTIYGSVRIGMNNQSDETIRVAYSTFKVDANTEEKNADSLWEAEVESAAAGLGGCDIIFWTEEAFQVNESEEKEFIENTSNIVKENGINAYLPTQLHQGNDKFQNCIYYFDKDEGFKHRYTKNHPVPGVESAYDTAEDKIYTERVNNSIVADIICFDNFFDMWVRKKIAKNTDILLIPSWDPANTEAFTTPATMFRAIELGVNAIRHTDEGRVMAFDVNGRTISNIRNTSLNRKAIYFMDMPAKGCDTIYMNFGDWFTLLCVLILLGSIASCVLPNRKKSK